MAGATFVRADLHVHTHSDGDDEPDPDLSAYVAAAAASDIGVLAITDHNSTKFVERALVAGKESSVFVIPGIEISTHDGHLLGLYPPSAVAKLERLANPDTLKLKDLGNKDARSSRSMLDLVEEIHADGGLAIPAHVDAGHGMSLSGAELEELLTSDALAGLEFASEEALRTWFTADDSEGSRHNAWMKRQQIPHLRERGLARLMSSDAHSIDKVGLDRTSRTLTRLRLDDANFDAVRNAVVFNPKARCKAEKLLPSGYPWIQSASFTGGFLDGVTLEFSPNLNCVIGGRGSGKSTALLAIRAALGAEVGDEDDPDEPGRMPDETRVQFVDGAGSERVAVRRRDSEPVDGSSGAAIRLRLADLGQDESGRLARGYRDAPGLLLRFLDGFIVKHEFEESEARLLADLEDNAAELRRTSNYEGQKKAQEGDLARLRTSLNAAKAGKVELIAKWADLLAAQGPFLRRLGEHLARAQGDELQPAIPDLDALAGEFGLSLSNQAAKKHVEGPDGLRAALGAMEEARREVHSDAAKQFESAAHPARKILAAWEAEQNDLEARLAVKREELKEQGLEVQAGVVEGLARRINAITGELEKLKKKETAYQGALKSRAELLSRLRDNRQRLHQTRAQKLKAIAASATKHAEDLETHVFFEENGMKDPWISWLGQQFSFRSPRVQRVAAAISPADFAAALWQNDLPKLGALTDDGGDAVFPDLQAVEAIRNLDSIFELETMYLDDRPRIQVREPGGSNRKELHSLSAGQQRSVLLGLMLCAEQSDPLVLDQPEDHLDAEYIASGVVKHLESAKERRQVLIATHNPNLTVLGDAELVVPMRVENGLGVPHDVGAVDRPETRDCVCALLEGGVEAYKKRGLRYGFLFRDGPA